MNMVTLSQYTGHSTTHGNYFYFWPKMWQHGKWVYTFKEHVKGIYILFTHQQMHFLLNLEKFKFT